MKSFSIKGKKNLRSWYWFFGLYLGSLLVIGLFMGCLRLIVYALKLV